MNKQETKMDDRHSVYYECSAQEVYKKCKRNLRLYNSCVFIIVLILMVIFCVTVNENNSETVLLLPLAIALIFSMRTNAGLNGLRMHEIMSVDCDPVKLLQVIEYGEASKQGEQEKKSVNFAKVQCCCRITEKIEEGFSDLMAYKSPKLTWNYESIRLNEIINYAFVMQDREAFTQAKEELEELPNRINKHNKREEKLYSQVMDLVCLKELFWDECNEEARQLANKLLQIDKTRCNRVFIHMILAQLDLREKKYDGAQNHLQFVITEGNTLSIVNDAKRLLNLMEPI